MYTFQYYKTPEDPTPSGVALWADVRALVLEPYTFSEDHARYAGRAAMYVAAAMVQDDGTVKHLVVTSPQPYGTHEDLAILQRQWDWAIAGRCGR